MVVFLVLIAALSMASCTNPDGPGGTSGGGDNPPVVAETYLIPKNLWGEWRDVNATGYYFAHDRLFTWPAGIQPTNIRETYEDRVISQNYSKYTPTNAKGAVLPTFTNVVLSAVSGEPDLLVWNGGLLMRTSSASSVKGTAMIGSLARGAVGTARPLGPATNVSLVLQNVLNAADRIQTTGGVGGSFTASGALAGDIYTVAAGAGTATPVTMIPGETEAGLIPEITGGDTGGSLPKLVLDPGTSERWLLDPATGKPRFVWAGTSATLSYSIRNPGTAPVSALSWTIETSGGSMDAGASGQFSTVPLAAGGKKGPYSFSFTPSAIPDTQDFVYTKFSVHFTMGAETWDDSFQVRVFREPMNFLFSSWSVNAFSKSPLGTFMNEQTNSIHSGSDGSPNVLQLPFIRGDWELTFSKWYADGHPYAWSCEGPMLTDQAVQSITVDPNEPNGPSDSPTLVDYGGLMYGKCENEDYDCFKLSVPEPAGAITEVETLAFGSTEIPSTFYDVGFEHDANGNPKVAALWLCGSGVKLGAWERSGTTWSGASTSAAGTANRLALKAETDGMSVFISTSPASNPSYRSYISGTWQSVLSCYLIEPNFGTGGWMYAQQTPIGAVYGDGIYVPVYTYSTTANNYSTS